MSVQGIHLKREKKKTNISQLSAIVISEEGNGGNNTMEMDLHYNTCAIEVAITNTRRRVDHVLLHSGLHASSFKTT